MSYEVISIFNLDEVLAHVQDAGARAVIRIGEAVSHHAQDELQRPKMHPSGDIRPNVVTGNLYRSIVCVSDTAGTEKTSYVGTNIPYASYVELGTSRSWAYPYLRPAVTDHLDEFREIAKQEYSPKYL